MISHVTLRHLLTKSRFSEKLPTGIPRVPEVFFIKEHGFALPLTRLKAWQLARRTILPQPARP